MTTIRIDYEPADVHVSDDRGTVPGAWVMVTGYPDDMSDDIIPPEGDSRECWLGYDLSDCDEEVIQALADAARGGAAGESGSITVQIQAEEATR